MKWEFALLLALCAITAAMVPRDRRAVDTESSTQEPNREVEHRFCAPSTPCGWSFYNQYTKIVTIVIPNTYCVCAEGYSCEEYQDDSNVSSYVRRCQKI